MKARLRTHGSVATLAKGNQPLRRIAPCHGHESIAFMLFHYFRVAALVRAQRREEDVRQVPIAVIALSGEQLKTLGISDARELGGVVPGLVVSEGGQGAPVYTLRGVGFTDSSYFATPTTAVYLDEVNLPYSIMSKGAIFDVEQVEVLHWAPIPNW